MAVCMRGNGVKTSGSLILRRFRAYIQPFLCGGFAAALIAEILSFLINSCIRVI